MFSISVVESLPTELEIVMLALRPDVFSVATTFRIPLTSTSNTHSRTASPAFIGGMGARVNSPRDVLSSQLTRSPWNTGNCTVQKNQFLCIKIGPGNTYVLCPSETVVNVLFFKQGTVCPRGTTGAKMLPSMATPSESGTTSRSSRSAVSADAAFPDKIPA